MTVQRAFAVARAFIAKRGKSLIVVDYLQLMSGPGQSRYEQVTNISAGLKTMAVELNCPVLALAQLNRQAADPSEVPNLSDLRDSGAIEQDADVVMFISRDTTREDAHPTTITVAKNRPGKIGKADLLFDTNGPRFKSIAKVEQFR
jgi:replicative DNA helicase